MKPANSGLEMSFRRVLADFSLAVALVLPGRGVTAIFGPSGSGKTSLLRSIAGLEPASRGQLVVNGEVWQDDAKGIFRPTYQRSLGFVFQEASLFAHLTVRRNLDFGLRRVPVPERRVSLDQAIELLGIEGLLQRQPGTLSGGERQRVAIARALATSPRLLLLDEPLASLDMSRKAEIIPYLERLHAQLDIPVLYVSHAPDEVARLADHLVLLDAGCVTAAGPTRELMTRLDLPLLQGDAAAALVEARVCGLAPSEAMCVLEFAGGRLVLPQTRTVPLPARARVRIRIQARDVSLSLQKPEQTSVLNILPATVVDITDDGPGQTLVALQVGEGLKTTRLLSRISQLSARRLGIATGQPVYAQIKGVAMVR